MNDEIEWLNSDTTMARVAAVMSKKRAQLTIAGRARDGLIRTQASRFIAGKKSFDNFILPASFWWAGGHPALEQNWVTGDFSTWIEHRSHWKAYGVRFCAADIDAMLPVASPSQAASGATKAIASKSVGRIKAEWWDDLWIEICRQLYVGDLQPEKQADISRAMLTWVENSGQTAGETIIKERAAKLWRAIERDGGN